MRTRFYFTILASVLSATSIAASEAEIRSKSVQLSLDLSDGSRIIGKPLAESLSVETVYATVNLKLELIARMSFSQEGEVVAIELRNGDKLTGRLGTEVFELETLFGEVSVPLEHMKQVLVRRHIVLTDEVKRNLVLWNSLGSNDEVVDSVVGPDLGFYAGSQRWPEVKGDREYVAGKYGKCVTIRGNYRDMSRIHNIVFNDLDKHLNPEKGCIELWFYYTEAPVAHSHGVYRFFDGAFGLRSGIIFQAIAQQKDKPARVTFSLNFGGEPVAVYLPISKIPKNQWVHLAAVWDRNGIEDGPETVRLYVDGKKVASGTAKGWGARVGKSADICGGNDNNLIGKFRMDELKVWRFAKTNFSDRFDQASESSE